MAGLTRTNTGRYVGRKIIPPDCRDEYARRHGPRHEAKFSAPASTREADAKQIFATWIAEIEGRIRAIRNGGSHVAAPVTKVKSKATAGPWQLFEQWQLEVRPAASTVIRWKPIFRELEARFGGSIITEDEAHRWARSQITPKRAPITVREIHLSAAKTVYAWAKSQRLVAANPFLEVKIAVPRKITARESKAFTDEEIIRILMTAICVEPRNTFDAAKRWVPWLLAYSGARGSEICQLRGQDVEERDGYWVMKLTPDAGTIKTKKARIVPIHEHVIAQGFLKYVEKRGRGPLFYEPGEGSRSQPKFIGRSPG